MNNTLYHHGIKGQKWGVRRYQNEDGSLTNKRKKQDKTKKNPMTKGKKITTGILVTAGGIGVATALVAANKNLSNTSFRDGRPTSLQMILAAPLLLKEFINR